LFNVVDKLEKHNEDFGQTLGYWGVSSGPYLVLPFFGPSSVRDGSGLYADSFASVIGRTKNMSARNRDWLAEGVNTRAGLLEGEKVLDEAIIDRYSFIRDAYLQRRQSLVYDGNPPRQKFDDDEE
jgi:phospholipid-binding lipoprotein MlaA